MMEPDGVSLDADYLNQSDDGEDVDQCASQNIDEETGCPVLPLEVQSWLQINSDIEDGADDYTYSSPLSSSSPPTRDKSAKQSSMKQKVSFHQSATVHYIPLPTQEEKRACFYSLDEITQFRSDAENDLWQQYLEGVMNRPLDNPFHPRPEDDNDNEKSAAADDVEGGSPPTPTLAHHHDDDDDDDDDHDHCNTVQNHQSQFIRPKTSEDEDEDAKEDRLDQPEQAIIEHDEAVALTKSRPMKVSKAPRNTCHHTTKQSLTLVAGFCILAYCYTR